ncbi:GNAT family N-acetyltransferase [Devosia sp. ZW T5_3]|uniref:GNAT family N-acetyltransferase n=1 Tax=Devosia sp. ZW T5_3 TaxID=3378085 RepID=UPI0038548DE2
MALSFAIEPAQPEQAEALAEIGISAWRQSAFGENDAERTAISQLSNEFKKFCRTSADKILVARQKGVPLGWGAREDGDHVISDLWVSSHAQGQGVGAALLDALEAAIASHGFTNAELETYAGNAGAVRFYQRHGYVPVWRGLKFSASLNYELDKIRFSKPLAGQAQHGTGLPRP